MIGISLNVSMLKITRNMGEFNLNRQELHEKVHGTVQRLIREKGYVSSLDLLLKMEKISSKQVEEWRFGKIQYLERVVRGNLSQLNYILTKLGEIARNEGLKESFTVYMSWGKGVKRPLRFSKSGDSHIERRYSTHYVKQMKEVNKIET